MTLPLLNPVLVLTLLIPVLLLGFVLGAWWVSTCVKVGELIVLDRETKLREELVACLKEYLAVGYSAPEADVIAPISIRAKAAIKAAEAGEP